MELTKQDMNVILNMLIDIDSTWSLEPEELELKEKIERWFADGQND